MPRWIAMVCLLLAACSKKDDEAATKPGPASAATPSTPAVEVEILYGSEKKTWLEEQIGAFNQSQAKVHVTGKAMGSGEAMQAILDGTDKPVVFSPASGAYVTLLNEHWEHPDCCPTCACIEERAVKPLAPAGDPLLLSPIVIAMWKPMAQALGWPDKPIGWKDILKVSESPTGWADLGRAEWGTFKLGHTHPEYSNSGLLAVITEAYAGAGKTRGLTAADLASKNVHDTMENVEDAIVHYGKSTALFSDNMVSRGPSYLSAAVMYENLVIESYAKSPAPEMPLVAVYPVEGTFWSDHPYSVLDADWVTPAEKDGAAQFLAFLKGKPAQERALALGFRPSDTSIPIAAPIDADHGCDPKQPQTLLDVPDGTTMLGVLDLWRKTKKSSDVTLVFDKSGSMDGDPLAQAKTGAKAFLATLDPRDQVSLLFFDSTIYPEVGPIALDKGKPDLEARIEGLTADGGTALYDAITQADDELLAKIKKDPHRIHALVVMTDGEDDGSKATLDQLLSKIGGEHSQVRVFTIAYGTGAGHDVLKQIADTSKGTFAAGDPSTIADVFRDMASFF